ncbi:MAG TPA: 3-methyl-2-oxobutanoate hydroxymethyltransferase [Vulgatibacter sp.]|nr:3-methyl-2-oxobutanoate hydroxymethyltransferase [Vulgatibacter sp.]
MATKVTIHTLRKMKQAGERIGMLTCYDATFARLLDGAGADVLLVGDSLGNVIQGEKTTLPVTVDQIVYHCRAVCRGTERAHVVGDMPFMSYQASVDEAVRNAGRIVAEGGAEAVKLEGGADFGDVIRKIVRAGIPVMGHIGLTPQSVHRMGGYVIQGRDEEKAAQLLADAVALEEAGCYSLVLEGIPASVAAEITARLSIPTIGIGAGNRCDGQVLVIYDLLGMNPSFSPKFVKRYAQLHEVIGGAVGSYLEEVRSGAFPGEEHSFRTSAETRANAAGPAAIDGVYGGGSKAAG